MGNMTARAKASVHAQRSWTCACGRTVWGNGGKSSHRRACAVYQDKLPTCYCCAEKTDNPRSAWCDNCTMGYKGDMIWHCAEHVKDIEVRLTV